jgi:tetratricopeptide (TPR) repeat protein
MRLLVMVIVSWSASAHADDVERARAHYKAGVSYFDEGQYARALGEFESAARFSPRPELEYNIGRCHEMLGESDLAIARFKRYLELRPNAPDRAEVDERLKRLQKRVRPTEVQPSLPPPVVVADQPPKKSRVGLWVGIGVGAAVVVGGVIAIGVVFGTRSSDGNNFWIQATNSCPPPCLTQDLR